MDGLTLDAALDTVSALLLLASAILTLSAGVGLIRFGDALSRLHAATKPQVLGLVCVLLAVAIEERTWVVALFAIPVLFLQVLTTPMAAHMVGRAAYRTGNFRTDLITLDELGPAIEAAGHTAPEGVTPTAREGEGRGRAGSATGAVSDDGQSAPRTDR